jgi:nickel-dependent lactate racemase
VGVISKKVSEDKLLSAEQAVEVVAKAMPEEGFRDRKVLLIVPDGTRTAPVGTLFKAIHKQIGGVTGALDVMIALGTHQPMSETAIEQRLEISHDERTGSYARVRFFNHAWDDPGALRHIGILPAEEIGDLSGGLFEMDVPVEVNAQLFDYDQIVIIGPVFPHEVVGFSGGSKYLFPGVSGPEVLHFFHWLAAVMTTPKIIGHKWTPVRKVVDRAGAMVKLPKLAFCMVVEGDGMCGLFAGPVEEAWSAAADLSAERHIRIKPKPFHTILACCPEMYDELWTAGKCMYKLEPVLADGGELIIYAPHIREVCVAHGETIESVGYHCRDYFLKQWDRFKDLPWGAIAHCVDVKGLGTYENGVETPRAEVTVASQLSEAKCRQINLGYRDPASINPKDFANREEEGILLVPHAGERLFRLANPPAWA